MDRPVRRVEKSKIRIIIEYEFRRGTNASQTARHINQAYGDNTVYERTVSRWFEKFRSGDFTLGDEPRGRPKPKVNHEELKTVALANPSQSTRELAARFNVSIPTILHHLKRSGVTKNKNGWVTRKINNNTTKNNNKTQIGKQNRIRRTNKTKTDGENQSQQPELVVANELAMATLPSL